MHTTLRLLKETKACIPGYSRMIGFFGTHASLKAAPIPFHMIALIGEVDDVEWAASNSAIIDKAEFEAFYRYHLASVVQATFWGLSAEADSSGDWSKQPAMVQELRRDIMNVVDYDSAKSWLEKLNGHCLNHWLWKSLCVHAPFYNSGRFLQYVINNFGQEIGTEHTIALMNPDVIDVGGRQMRFRHAARITAFRKTMKHQYYFQDFEKGRPANISLAHVLACGKDPYQMAVEFIATHSVAKRGRSKGVMLSQANDGQPPGFHMTINVSDPERIFRVFHALNASELNVNAMLGVDHVGEQVEAALSEQGLPDDSSSINERLVTNEYTIKLGRIEERLVAAGDEDKGEEGDEAEDCF